MLPFLAKIGSVIIPTQPIFWCLSYVIGLIVAMFLARRAGLPIRKVFNGLIVGVAAAEIGARISAVFLLTRSEELRWFLDHPGHIFHFWESGYSFYGVIVFGSMVGVWYTLRSGLPVFRIGDLGIPCVALGYVIQNIGDFLGGAHPGSPTSLPWGVIYTHWTFAGMKGIPLHPVMLYIATIGLLGTITAWAWLQIRDHPGKKFLFSWFFYPAFRVLRLRFIDGELYFLGGAFYAIFRFFVEFSRDPRTLIWYPDFPLPQTQMACLGIFIFCWGGYFILRAIRETERKGLPYRGWMKLCFQIAEGSRWLAKNIPWPVSGEGGRL